MMSRSGFMVASCSKPLQPEDMTDCRVLQTSSRWVRMGLWLRIQSNDKTYPGAARRRIAESVALEARRIVRKTGMVLTRPPS